MRGEGEASHKEIKDLSFSMSATDQWDPIQRDTVTVYWGGGGTKPKKTVSEGS